MAAAHHWKKRTTLPHGSADTRGVAAARAPLRGSARRTDPAQAGRRAGVLAGAFGAMLYATHCADNSPLFVLTWYSAAIAITAALGATLGHKFLRW